MRITTRVQLKWDEQAGRYFPDPETWEGYEYSGPVDECKGADTAKSQLDLQNQLQQQQLTQQKAIRDQIMGSVGKYLSGAGEGFDPQQLAIMQSQFLNQNSQNFNQAGGQVLSSLRARGVAGGDMAAGGDFTRGMEALQGARASSQSQGILGTNLANLQQALTNKFNAASVSAGQSAQLGSNIGTFGQGASSALSSYVTAANSSPFMNMLGSALGAGIGAIGTAGIGSSLGGVSKALGGASKGLGGMSPGNIGFCWIAEALYGVNDIRTYAARKYLTGDFGKTIIGKLFVSAYKKFGKRLATSRVFVSMVKPLFDSFSRKGMKLIPKADINDFESIWYQR